MTDKDTACSVQRGGKCPCMSPCPLEKSLEFIGGKWKIPILCALHKDGPLRYNDLKRKIAGITNTMLASTLKELVSCGLASRTQYMEMPVRVEYAVTEQCGELMPILEQLAHWGVEAMK